MAQEKSLVPTNLEKLPEILGATTGVVVGRTPMYGTSPFRSRTTLQPFLRRAMASRGVRAAACGRLQSGFAETTSNCSRAQEAGAQARHRFEERSPGVVGDLPGVADVRVDGLPGTIH